MLSLCSGTLRVSFRTDTVISLGEMPQEQTSQSLSRRVNARAGKASRGIAEPWNAADGWLSQTALSLIPALLPVSRVALCSPASLSEQAPAQSYLMILLGQIEGSLQSEKLHLHFSINV